VNLYRPASRHPLVVFDFVEFHSFIRSGCFYSASSSPLLLRSKRSRHSTFYLFPKNFSIFICQNFWWLFFSRRNFPSTLKNFLPSFIKIHLLFTYFMCISFPPTFTMMHLCITQCTYWTPLSASWERYWLRALESGSTINVSRGHQNI